MIEGDLRLLLVVDVVLVSGGIDDTRLVVGHVLLVEVVVDAVPRIGDDRSDRSVAGLRGLRVEGVLKDGTLPLLCVHFLNVTVEVVGRLLLLLLSEGIAR